MPPLVIAGAVAAAGSIAGGVLSAQGASKAAGAQVEATERAAQLQLTGQRESIAAQMEMFNLTREDLAPYLEAGTESLGYLRDLNAPGGEFQQDFGLADFEADPGYQFRLTEGMKAIERSASARGNLLSGRQLKDVQRFGQGLASDEYGRAYGRFNADRDRRFNRLAALSGIGQTAGTATGQFATSTGSNIGQTYLSSGNRLADIELQAGNARASGYAGRARAYGGVAQNLASLPTQLYSLQSLGAFK